MAHNSSDSRVTTKDTPEPLVRLLAGHGGPELPDPIPHANIPPDMRRAYTVLTTEALRRVIADAEATPPEAFADLVAEGLAAARVSTLDELYDVDDADLDLTAEQRLAVRTARDFRAELNGMRALEWRVQEIAGAVLAQLLPFIQQHPITGRT